MLYYIQCTGEAFLPKESLSVFLENSFVFNYLPTFGHFQTHCKIWYFRYYRKFNNFHCCWQWWLLIKLFTHFIFLKSLLPHIKSLEGLWHMILDSIKILCLSTIWTISYEMCKKIFSQSSYSHLAKFFVEDELLLWFVEDTLLLFTFICVMRLFLCLYFVSQIIHWYGLSLICIIICFS